MILQRTILAGGTCCMSGPWMIFHRYFMAGSTCRMKGP